MGVYIENPAYEGNVYNPMQDVTENKNLFFQLLLIKALMYFAEKPGGMKTLQVLGKELIHGLFNTLDSLGQASSANAIAAWANPKLVSGVLERFGLLPAHFNKNFHAGLNIIGGVDLASNILGDLLGREGAFPSNLVFAKGGWFRKEE